MWWCTIGVRDNQLKVSTLIQCLWCVCSKIRKRWVSSWARLWWQMFVCAVVTIDCTLCICKTHHIWFLAPNIFMCIVSIILAIDIWCGRRDCVVDTYYVFSGVRCWIFSSLSFCLYLFFLGKFLIRQHRCLAVVNVSIWFGAADKGRVVVCENRHVGAITWGTQKPSRVRWS